MDQKIKKDDWKNYFDFVSKVATRGQRIELEVNGTEIGDQIEATNLLLLGLTYDPREDILHVHADSVDHPIPAPKAIVVDEENFVIRSIAVQDGGDSIQILHFRPPLVLERPMDNWMGMP